MLRSSAWGPHLRLRKKLFHFVLFVLNDSAWYKTTEESGRQASASEGHRDSLKDGNWAWRA